MKCPKCGYNSFDHLESCKKCGNDLVGHKARFGLRSLFFPDRHSGPPEQEPAGATELEHPFEEPAPASDPTDFGFDFMSEQEASPADPSESSLDHLLGAEVPLEIEEDFPPEEPDSPAASVAVGPMEEESPDAGALESSDLDFAWDEEPPPAPLETAAGSFEVDLESAGDLAEEELPDFNFGDEASIADRQDPLAGFEPKEMEGFSDREGPEEIGDGSGDLSDPLPDADFAFDGDLRGEAATQVDGLPLEEPEDRKAGSLPDENLAKLFLDSFDETIDTGDFPAGDFPPSVDLPPLGNDIFEANSLTVPEVTVTEVAPPEDFAGFAEEEAAVSSAPDDLGEEAAGEVLSAPEENTIPSLTARFGAGVADLLILGLIFVLFVAAGEIALSRDPGGGIFPTVATLLELSIPYFLVLFAVFFGYFTLFHFLIGQTPGKILFRLRVEGVQGGALLLSQAFLRSVGGLLSLLPVGLGYLRIALDAEGRGWNDRLANSRVVRADRCRDFEETAEGGLAEEI
jgi:uncharacterized RDD family membrane protein YckC